MKALAPALEQAQHSRSVRATCQAVLSAHHGTVPVPAWQTVLDGSPGTDLLAAAITGSGAVLRLRVTPGEAHLSRVPSPLSPGAPWTSWDGFGAADSSSRPALAAREDRVLAAVVDLAGTIQVRTSTDAGATWSGWSALDAGGGSGQQLALALVTPTRGLLLAQRAAGSLRAWSWTAAGGWTAASVSPHPAWAGRGVAVVHGGADWLVLTLEDEASGGTRLRERWFGDGGAFASGTWSAPVTLLATSPGSGVVLRGLSLGLHSVPRYRLTQQADAGWSLALEASRPGGPLPGAGWTEATPAPPTGSQQPVLASGPGGTWRVGTALAQHAPLPGPTLDLAPWLRSASWSVGRRHGRARLVLDNARGALDAAGSGSLALLHPGSRLALVPGILVNGAPGSGRAWHFQVERVSHEVRPGLARVLLDAVGPWEVLGQLRLQQPLRWSGIAPATAATALLGRAGWAGLASLGTSAAWTSTSLDLDAPAGTSLAALLDDVLTTGPDEVVFREGAPFALDPTAAGDPVASLGPGHPALDCLRATASPTPNLVLASGAAGSWLLADPVAATGVRARGLPLDDAAPALLAVRARAALDRARAAAPSEEVTTAPLIGLDLLDRLTVTVPRSGLAGALRRAETIAFRWSSAGDWDQRLHLSTTGDAP